MCTFAFFLINSKGWKIVIASGYKVGGLEMAHLRAGPPFSCTSLNGNIFSSFFRQREIDEEFNTSGFIFFKALLNYL